MKAWDNMTAGTSNVQPGNRQEIGAWLMVGININRLTVANNKSAGIFPPGDIPEELVG